MNKSFEKIIGYKNVKDELMMVLDIMKNEEKYKKLGAKIPKNILLHGVPGVGKSLFANAFVELCDRKTYVIRKNKPNGSFVDEIKSIFEEAKNNQPSIVVLDDLDKFSNGDQNHVNCEEYITVQSCIDEAKEMDVFVFATANSLGNLPPSLFRSGRFDKKIEVRVANGEDSKSIIKHYLSDKMLDDSINSDVIARILEGDSCAGIETIINNAAVYAGYANREKICLDDIIKAIIDIRYGREKDNEKLTTDSNLSMVAYHEAGHAVMHEILFPNTLTFVLADFGEISNGITSYHISKDLYCNLEHVKNRIIIALSGKAAIEVVFGKPDMGCRSDLREAYCEAESIVDDHLVYGFDKFLRRTNSNQILERRENTISMLLEQCYQEAKRILIKNRLFLDKVANELLQKKVLIYTDIDRIKESCKVER